MPRLRIGYVLGNDFIKGSQASERIPGERTRRYYGEISYEKIKPERALKSFPKLSGNLKVYPLKKPPSTPVTVTMPNGEKRDKNSDRDKNLVLEVVFIDMRPNQIIEDEDQKAQSKPFFTAKPILIAGNQLVDITAFGDQYSHRDDKLITLAAPGSSFLPDSLSWENIKSAFKTELKNKKRINGYEKEAQRLIVCLDTNMALPDLLLEIQNQIRSILTKAIEKGKPNLKCAYLYLLQSFPGCLQRSCLQLLQGLATNPFLPTYTTATAPSSATSAVATEEKKSDHTSNLYDDEDTVESQAIPATPVAATPSSVAISSPERKIGSGRIYGPHLPAAISSPAAPSIHNANEGNPAPEVTQEALPAVTVLTSAVTVSNVDPQPIAASSIPAAATPPAAPGPENPFLQYPPSQNPNSYPGLSPYFGLARTPTLPVSTSPNSSIPAVGSSPEAPQATASSPVVPHAPAMPAAVGGHTDAIPTLESVQALRKRYNTLENEQMWNPFGPQASPATNQTPRPKYGPFQPLPRAAAKSTGIAEKVKQMFFSTNRFEQPKSPTNNQAPSTATVPAKK